jgi:fused signal recognition particle receptor
MAVIHAGLSLLLVLPLIVIDTYCCFEAKTIDKFDKSAKLIEPSDGSAVIKTPVEFQTDESLYGRLKSQLQRTRQGIGGIFATLSFSRVNNDQVLEEIETSLLLADVGVTATTSIIARLRERIDSLSGNEIDPLEDILKQELLEILRPCSVPLSITKQERPFVILVVGINGAGKTTTIGKLANRLINKGHSVMLAAGDTFRAAAVEQLQTWGERNQIPVVAQHTGADSASVIFDALQSAQSKGIDVLIADTAGRLQTKSNLMDELKKIKRIVSKLDETAPHEVLLVLDAGTGQNAVSQTNLFNEAVSLTGLALTKLDGTAKGGVIFSLAKQFGIPIRFIGIGEHIEDLQDFDAQQFVDALFTKD